MNCFVLLAKKKKVKKKKSKAYLPTLFFSGKEPETQLFFLLALSGDFINKSQQMKN